MTNFHKTIRTSMKPIRLLQFLVLISILSSCGGNQPDRPSKKSQEDTIATGDAFFPYFVKARALKVHKRFTYGYMNKKGERVSDNQFADAHTFTDGLGCVGVFENHKIKYGYIDPSGNFKIKPKYERARPFQEERAVVCRDTNMWLVIDKNGAELTDARYNIISDYYNGTCYGFVYKRSEQRKVFLRRNLQKISLYDCYQIDKSGNATLIAEDVDEVDLRDSSTLANMDFLGMYWIHDANDDRSYGYRKITHDEFDQSPWSSCGNYKDKGVEHIKAQFWDAECFEGGYARVKLSSEQSAYIDTNGKTVCTFTDDR